jgi:hypothetical protein
MKKVNAEWLSPYETESVKVESFGRLVESYKFVGFSPHLKTDRYMICMGGPICGAAVNHKGMWTIVEMQKTSFGEYFIFDSASELYEWMKT